MASSALCPRKQRQACEGHHPGMYGSKTFIVSIRGHCYAVSRGLCKSLAYSSAFCLDSNLIPPLHSPPQKKNPTQFKFSFLYDFLFCPQSIFSPSFPNICQSSSFIYHVMLFKGRKVFHAGNRVYNSLHLHYKCVTLGLQAIPGPGQHLWWPAANLDSFFKTV